jgi:hypothetical protein
MIMPMMTVAAIIIMPIAPLRVAAVIRLMLLPGAIIPAAMFVIVVMSSMSCIFAGIITVSVMIRFSTIIASLSAAIAAAVKTCMGIIRVRGAGASEQHQTHEQNFNSQ